jgi:hypothetical protein
MRAMMTKCRTIIAADGDPGGAAGGRRTGFEGGVEADGGAGDNSNVGRFPKSRARAVLSSGLAIAEQ